MVDRAKPEMTLFERGSSEDKRNGGSPLEYGQLDSCLGSGTPFVFLSGFFLNKFPFESVLCSVQCPTAPGALDDVRLWTGTKSRGTANSNECGSTVTPGTGFGHS